MARKPLIRDDNTAVVVGLVVLAAGFYLLWDAFEGRRRKKPLWLGPFAPW